MSGAEQPRSFVDTNILVYALAGDDAKRSPVAQTLIRELVAARVFRTSTQVLQELFVTLTRKVRTPLSVAQALRYMDQLVDSNAVVTDYESVRDAAMLSETARLSFWDALIVVAAAKSGATRLYTDDLQDGQVIMGVEVVNPFAAPRKN